VACATEKTSAGIAASNRTFKIGFTATLPKNEIPWSPIESQDAKKVAGECGGESRRLRSWKRTAEDGSQVEQELGI